MMHWRNVSQPRRKHELALRAVLPTDCVQLSTPPNDARRPQTKHETLLAGLTSLHHLDRASWFDPQQCRLLFANGKAGEGRRTARSFSNIISQAKLLFPAGAVEAVIVRCPV